MPKILVQTDDGDTVQTLEFPIDSTYALDYMPGCPTHMGVHRLLSGLRRALQDATAVQEGRDPRHLSERVMDSLSESDRVAP